MMKRASRCSPTEQVGSMERWILVDESIPQGKLGEIVEFCETIIEAGALGSTLDLAVGILHIAALEEEQHTPKPCPCPEAQLSLGWCRRCGLSRPPKGSEICDHCVEEDSREIEVADEDEEKVVEPDFGRQARKRVRV